MRIVGALVESLGDGEPPEGAGVLGVDATGAAAGSVGAGVAGADVVGAAVVGATVGAGAVVCDVVGAGAVGAVERRPSVGVGAAGVVPPGCALSVPPPVGSVGNDRGSCRWGAAPPLPLPFGEDDAVV